MLISAGQCPSSTRGPLTTDAAAFKLMAWRALCALFAKGSPTQSPRGGQKWEDLKRKRRFPTRSTMKGRLRSVCSWSLNHA